MPTAAGLSCHDDALASGHGAQEELSSIERGQSLAVVCHLLLGLRQRHLLAAAHLRRFAPLPKWMQILDFVVGFFLNSAFCL